MKYNSELMTDHLFKVRSLYLAAYMMCGHSRRLVGTEMQDRRVIFLFDAEGNEHEILDEFSGIKAAMVNIGDYMKSVNQLKDVAKSLTKDQS